MSDQTNEAAEIITDYFGVKGRFSGYSPEGMSASVYPQALADFLRGVDQGLQQVTVALLLDYAMDGDHPFSKASAHDCFELVLRGLSPAFAPHVQKIMKWLEDGLRAGWWTTDAMYESAPMQARNVISLINVLWCCDENSAAAITKTLISQTTSKELKDSLSRSKLLPQVRKAVLGPDKNSG
jgi:hypothetical protein